MLDNSVDKIFLKYKLALDKLKTKFNSIYEGYVGSGVDSPIEHLKYRIKKLDSIEEKLRNDAYQNGEDFDDNLFLDKIDTLNDIVGVRVVCLFLDDMKKIIDIIEEDTEIEILNRKDFVTNPKDSGYRSYHMIVRVPVVIADKKVMVKAEIQIRTIVMDMWASLEHKIWYKKGIVLPEEVKQSIADTAIVCANVDKNLNNLIQKAKDQYLKPNMVSNELPKGRDYAISNLKYEMALGILEGKINALYEEYERLGEVNPIEHVKSRMKPFDKIVSKLGKQNRVYTVSNMESLVHDVAGLRIVCSFSSDLPKIIQMLRADTDLRILEEQDFVTNPKASGYRGYHMLVLVPVRLRSGVSYRKVEVQIRTISMEVWASVEHKLCYQKEAGPEVKDELNRYADIFRVIDENMDKTIWQSRKLIEQKEKGIVKKKTIKE